MRIDLTTVILAGGLGTRLRPVISDRPKVLAPVNGQPFLAHLLDQVTSAGLRRVILCTGYEGHRVQRAFGDQYGPLTLAYSQESEPLLTAGAIRHALPLVQSDPVLVLNGDSYCEVNLTAFFAWHRARRSLGSLVLAHVQDTGRYGRAMVDDEGAIISFEEKEQINLSARSTPGWINAGIYLLSHELISSIPSDRPVSLEREILLAWVGRGLYGYQGGTRFIDIGTPQSYSEAECFFQSQERLTGKPQGTTVKARQSANGRPVVLLDRDGTLNVECHYLSDPAGMKLLPGVTEGLRRLRDLGLGLVVVTNQSAIGRGYMTPARLDAIHTRLWELLDKDDVKLDGIYVCPHRPEESCRCRKPELGLVEKAAAELGFDPRESFVIGDKACDIALGQRVGATTILVTTGYGREALADPKLLPDFVVDELAEAAEVVAHLVERRQDGNGEQLQHVGPSAWSLTNR